MPQPRVGIVLGSSSDEDRTKAAGVILEKFGVEYELEVLSAHRSPRRVAAYASSAEDRGLQVLIAAAGKAAALPGVLAAHTVLPVIGIPIFTPQLGGQDSLYSIVQMPAGIPVATFAIGNAGASNAALFAAAMLAPEQPAIGQALEGFRSRQTEDVMAHDDPRQ